MHSEPGIAYIACHEDSVILPIGLSGIERIGDWRRLKRPSCTVNIGEPFRLVQPEGKPTLAEMQAMADAVMIQIGRQLPESYRGYYADRIAEYEASGEWPSEIVPVAV